MARLQTLTWEDYLVFPKWTVSNHISQLKEKMLWLKQKRHDRKKEIQSVRKTTELIKKRVHSFTSYKTKKINKMHTDWEET